MKVAFVGPSLHGADVDWGGLLARPPASQGDVHRAVREGATAIGLIDGYFDGTASVWHKELLFALREGVQVLGGASMGAIRASECAAFGMEPVGSIARTFLEEERDDGFVALCHAPADFGYEPLTEPLVDVLATLAHLTEQCLVTPGEAAILAEVADRIHFTQRTLDALLASVSPERRAYVGSTYLTHRISIKRADALAVLARLRGLPSRRREPPSWTMNEPPIWREFVTATRG